MQKHFLAFFNKLFYSIITCLSSMFLIEFSFRMCSRSISLGRYPLNPLITATMRNHPPSQLRPRRAGCHRPQASRRLPAWPAFSRLPPSRSQPRPPPPLVSTLRRLRYLPDAGRRRKPPVRLSGAPARSTGRSLLSAPPRGRTRTLRSRKGGGRIWRRGPAITPRPIHR